MIVVSFLLVLASLGLLVSGVLRPSVSLVAGSIAASLLAFGALYVGIRQRSGPTLVESADPAQPVPDRSPPQTRDAAAAAGKPSQPENFRLAEASDQPTSSTDAPQPAGRTDQVRVIDGRPLYHLASCQQLIGCDAVAISVGGARAAGFTPCRVCGPDQTLPTGG